MGKGGDLAVFKTKDSNGRMGEEEKPKDNVQFQRNVVIISNFLDMFSLAVTLPSTPKLFAKFGLRTVHQGWTSSAYFLVSFLSAPILGRMSDVYGRVAMLKLSMIGSLIGFLVSIVATDYRVFVLSRVLPGLVKCATPVSQAFLSDISTEKTRAENLGLQGAAFGVAFIIGPLLGGFVAESSIRYPIMLSALAAAINFCLLCLLHEPGQTTSSTKKNDNKDDKDDKDDKNDRKNTGILHTISHIFKATPYYSKIFYLLHLRGVIVAAQSLYHSSLVPHLVHNLGLDNVYVGGVLSMLGAVGAISHAFLATKIVKSIPGQVLLPLVTTIKAFVLFVWGITGQLSIVLVASCLSSLLATVTQNVNGVRMQHAAGHENAGAIMGMTTAVDCLVNIIAPPLSGMLLQTYGATAISLSGASMMLYVAAVVFALETAGYIIRFPIVKKKET